MPPKSSNTKSKTKNTLKKEKPRPSPTIHASSQPVGTRLPGSDGFVYVVQERKDKTKFWRKTIVLASKMPKISGQNKIAIGEVSSSIIDSGFSVQLKIMPSFLEVLRKKPKYITNNQSNAYIFGHMHTSGYYIAGSHGNDVAQTGILDMQKITKDELTSIQDYNKWLKIFMPSKKEFHDWAERPLLKQVQKDISPRIIFVGTTVGGDVGANVLVHLNNKKEIDGLIIDNEVFF